MKKGDRVQFKFQGQWTVNKGTFAMPNEGIVYRVDKNQVVVKTGNGAKFHLSRDCVREPE